MKVVQHCVISEACTWGVIVGVNDAAITGSSVDDEVDELEMTVVFKSMGISVGLAVVGLSVAGK